jgi:type VI secretion system FHA domain protein
VALKLTLSGAARGTRTLTTGTLSIGRGERNDWQLTDPERHLSKTHCVISAENGKFVLTDLSTNGMYINGARQPTSRDSRITLTDGDEFRLGEYSITVEDVPDPVSARPEAGSFGRETDPLDIDPLDDPLGRPPDPSFSHPAHQVPVIKRMDDPFDRQDEQRGRPGASADDDLFSGAKPAVNWTGPSQPDHADAPRHAMPVPRVVPPANPMDIDFDALIGDLSPFSPPAPPPPAPPPPMARPPAIPDPLADPRNPFAEPTGLSHPAPIVPFPAATPLAPAVAQQPPGADAMQHALQLVLEGAGIANSPFAHGMKSESEATLRIVGQILRALTDGLREVLLSRTAIKGEMRVEQTMMKSNNNNPLKFSFTTDDAMVALLSADRPGYMPPLAATREAFDDIKLHELAVMAALQAALVNLLHRFDPEQLESRLASNVLGTVLPAARKARLWDNFRELYKTIAGEAEDDFQAAFGRAFAKAYTAQTRRE